MPRVEVIGDVRALQDQRDIEHRHVDVLALARAQGLVERRCNRERAHRAGRVIDHRRADLDRPACLRARGSGDSRSRLDRVIVGGLRAARPVLPERRHRRVNELGLQARELFIAQTQRLERAGAVIFDQHVGPIRDETLQCIAPACGLQVERNRALVRTLSEITRAHARLVERVIRAALAALVRLVGVFHLDHVGAEHRELVRRERPREHVRTIEYPDAFVWSHGLIPASGSNNAKHTMP